MKYKLIGGVNLFIGFVYVLFAALLHFFVYPQLSSIYEQMNPAQNTYQNYQVLYVGAMTVIGLINFYFGIKLFQKNNKSKDKFYTYGIIAFVVSIILSSFLVAFTISSSLMPLYSLTKEI
ncbi:MAG: hypothetical protein NUV98_04835 [Candidatus Roizmanbacteria bacterium]|nr:hypothetical protein [Candidatus Roizmanbacteria bacterium]